MRAVVKAILASTRLAAIVREQSLNLELRMTAENVLHLLHEATLELKPQGYPSYALGECIKNEPCIKRNPEACRTCRQEILS